MTELEEKLKALGVLDKFEANLEVSSKMVQEICGVASMPEGKSYTDFIKMLCEINPKDAMGSAFRWDETPEGSIFWRIVAELVTYSIEMLSPELLRFTYTKYMALN